MLLQNSNQFAKKCWPKNHSNLLPIPIHVLFSHAELQSQYQQITIKSLILTLEAELNLNHQKICKNTFHMRAIAYGAKSHM